MGQKRQRTSINLVGSSTVGVNKTRKKRVAAKKGRRTGKSIRLKARTRARSSR